LASQRSQLKLVVFERRIVAHPAAAIQLWNEASSFADCFITRVALRFQQIQLGTCGAVRRRGVSLSDRNVRAESLAYLCSESSSFSSLAFTSASCSPSHVLVLSRIAASFAVLLGEPFRNRIDYIRRKRRIDRIEVTSSTRVFG